MEESIGGKDTAGQAGFVARLFRVTAWSEAGSVSVCLYSILATLS